MVEDLSHCRILLVDDAKTNLDVLVSALRNDYRISVALNGASALVQAKKHPPDLILLDVMMPGMDGYEVCTRLKADKATGSIPVIFVTALDTVYGKSKGFDLGAVDYIAKPYELAELKARIRTHLTLQRALKALAGRNRELDLCVREHTRELRETQLEIIYRLSRAVESRDNETAMHVKRLSHFCRVVAAACGCGEETCELMFRASPMHDIGKAGMPDRVLFKTGPLDLEERAVMQSHTAKGAEILSGHDSPLLAMARAIALTHHENWDGSGYPRGLSGGDIPLGGRIVAVCDAFDALTSFRPYKKVWPLADALAEIRGCSGTRFDPRVVDAFFKALPDVLEIMNQFPDDTHADSSAEEPAAVV